MTVSIIIPAHNEENAIATTVNRVLSDVQVPFELIVVLDHCTDRTGEIVKPIQDRDQRIRMIENSDRRGSFSNAVITGIKAARGNMIVPLMADNCDDPATINRMAAEIGKGADIVCASRYMRGGRKIGGPVLQNILSRIVCYGLKIFSGLPTWDGANAYKMYRSDLLRSLDFDIPDAGTEYSLALLLRARKAKAKITEVPTTWRGTPMPIRDELKILRRFKGYCTSLRS